jgi:hypothetical protein
MSHRHVCVASAHTSSVRSQWMHLPFQQASVRSCIIIRCDLHSWQTGRFLHQLSVHKGPCFLYIALPTNRGPCFLYIALPTNRGPCSLYIALPTNKSPCFLYIALPTNKGPCFLYNALPTNKAMLYFIVTERSGRGLFLKKHHTYNH